MSLLPSNDVIFLIADVSTKPWVRGGRRREPSSGTYAKTDLRTKPTPQRNKTTVDKRPRPRGCYYSGAVVGGNESAWLETPPDAELGSVFTPGSKKQSLNHLLNFHFEPRSEPGGRGGCGSTGTVLHRGIATVKHKYNKEQFLQAK